MGASAYIRTIREAVIDWLQWTRGVNGVIGGSPVDEFTPTGYPIESADAVGRSLVLTGTAGGLNDGTFVATGTDGTALSFADAFPGGAESGVTYAFQSSVAYRAKSMFFFEASKRRPPEAPTSNNCPMIVLFPESEIPHRQANSGQVEARVTLDFLLATAGRELGDIEDWFTQVVDRLYLGRQERFGGLSADSGLNGVSFTSAKFERRQTTDGEGNPSASGQYYTAQFAMEMDVRRTPQRFI